MCSGCHFGTVQGTVKSVRGGPSTILLPHSRSVLVSDSSRDGNVVRYVQQDTQDSFSEDREMNNLLKAGRSPEDLAGIFLPWFRLLSALPWLGCVMGAPSFYWGSSLSSELMAM